MAESHRILQSLFRHAEIRLYISFLEDEDVFFIQIIYIGDQISVFLRKQVPDRIDQFVVMTMGLSAFLESGVTGSCLFIIISQIRLRHESVVHDIVPIADEE